MEPLSRDDFMPHDEEELVKKLGELHPGKKIVFAGDENLPPEIQNKINALLAELKARNDRSLVEGLCAHCGVKYPDAWPPPDDAEHLAEGWGFGHDLKTDELCNLLCPKC